MKPNDCKSMPIFYSDIRRNCTVHAKDRQKNPNDMHQQIKMRYKYTRARLHIRKSTGIVAFFFYLSEAPRQSVVVNL